MSSVESASPVSTPDRLDALRRGAIRDPEERLRTASALLEGAFYRTMYEAMRATVPEGGLIPKSGGERTFVSLLDQRIAEMTALEGGGGLGRALYRYFAERSGGVAAGKEGS